jgi:hypothetical protein
MQRLAQALQSKEHSKLIKKLKASLIGRGTLSAKLNVT